MITIKLPSQLRPFADGLKTLTVEAQSLGQAFDQLHKAAPMIRSQVFDDAGAIRPFVGIFLNGEQLETLGDGTQSLVPGSTLMLVMAVAGG